MPTAFDGRAPATTLMPEHFQPKRDRFGAGQCGKTKMF